MLYRVIEAHGGTLPDDVLVVFCNTGKEHERTLDFVENCAVTWKVPIRWIEYVDHDEPAKRVREVNYDTASREGEPFAAVIGRKQMLPNPAIRLCTVEMKIHALHRFVRSLGWESGYTKAVGLRADEPWRIAKAGNRGSRDGWELAFPLYDAGLTLWDVVAFWKEQPFRLALPTMPDGTVALGNCDLCFLKGYGKISSIIAEQPERAVWWAAQEARPIGAAPHLRLFRKDRPSYQAMLDQRTLFIDDADDNIDDCTCTD